MLLLAASTSFAANKSWNYPDTAGTRNLNASGNWNPSGVPGADDDAYIVFAGNANNRHQTLTNAFTDIFSVRNLSITNAYGGSNKADNRIFFKSPLTVTSNIVFAGSVNKNITTLTFSNNVNFHTFTFSGGAGDGATLTFAGSGTVRGTNFVFNSGSGKNYLTMSSSGGMWLAGNLTLNVTHADNRAEFAANTTVAGQLTVAGNQAGFFNITNATLTVSNGVSNTGSVNIRNLGLLGSVRDWTNSGYLDVDGNGAVTGGTLTNAGTVTVSGFVKSALVNSNRLILSGVISNNLLQTAGSFTLAGTSTITGSAAVNGGALNLSGNRLVTETLNVTGLGVLTNAVAGATLQGGLNNSATVDVTATTFITGPATNAGNFFWQGAISNDFVQTAGTTRLNGAATITQSATVSGGQLNLNGQSLSNGLLVITGAGMITNGLAGGAIAGAVSNAAIIAVTANTFLKGAVTNTGAMYFQGAISNHVANAGSFTLHNTTTITGTLANSGLVHVTNGTLRLLSSPIFTGTATVANASSINVTPAWANAGTLVLRGGYVDGGDFTNSASAQVTGFGTVSSKLVNLGSLNVTNGTLRVTGTLVQTGHVRVANSSTLSVSGSWNNDKTISMEGGVIDGSGVVNNGTISGHGSLSVAVSNPGYIRATNGTLYIQSLTGNQATGLIEVSDGGTLQANGINSWINNGQVTLSGGTIIGGSISNNAANVIKGVGKISNKVHNSGTIEAVTSGGTLEFDGDSLNNAVSGVITANQQNLVIHGAFTNTGTFSMMHSVGTFRSTVVNMGAWVTDPTTNIFHNNHTVTSSGYISADAGDVYLFTTNNPGSGVASFINQSQQSNSWKTLNVPVGSPGMGTKFLFEGDGVQTQNFFHVGLALTGGFTGMPTPLTTGVQTVSTFSAVSGFKTNFALGTLELTNTTLVLSQTFPSSTITNALFVNNLFMLGDSHLIISNNMRLYFVNSNDWTMANVTLLGNAQIHQIVTLLTVVPEPGTATLWLAGFITLVAMRKRKKG